MGFLGVEATLEFSVGINTEAEFDKSHLCCEWPVAKIKAYCDP